MDNSTFNIPLVLPETHTLVCIDLKIKANWETYSKEVEYTYIHFLSITDILNFGYSKPNDSTLYRR